MGDTFTFGKIKNNGNDEISYWNYEVKYFTAPQPPPIQKKLIWGNDLSLCNILKIGLEKIEFWNQEWLSLDFESRFWKFFISKLIWFSG